MSSPANNSISFVIEDNDTGLRYGLSTDNQQYQDVTVSQVEKVVVETSRDVSSNASLVSKHRTSGSAAAAGALNLSTSSPPTTAGNTMLHHTDSIVYESTVIPLDLHAAAVPTSATVTTTPALLPGFLALYDAADKSPRDRTERADTRTNQQSATASLHTARHRAHPSSHLSTQEAPMQVLSSTATSGIFFVIDSDNDEYSNNNKSLTEESVSFHEDMVSMTYQALMPPAKVTTSAAQSVQFETEEDKSEMEFDSISFATVETSHTPMKAKTMAGEATITATLAAAAAATARNNVSSTSGFKKATTIADPVANMTVRQRFEYYLMRGNRKNKTVMATATEREAADATKERAVDTPPPPPVLLSTTVETQLTSAPSVVPSVTTATSLRKSSKKAASPRADRKEKHIATTATARSPPPASNETDAAAGLEHQASTGATTTPATEREMKLAALVQQLQKDVQMLLVQSHTDASRIATLRGALMETKKEYRALHEAHRASLNQLNAYAAQIAAGVLPAPQQDEKEEKNDFVAAAVADHIASGAEPTNDREAAEIPFTDEVQANKQTVDAGQLDEAENARGDVPHDSAETEEAGLASAERTEPLPAEQLATDESAPKPEDIEDGEEEGKDAQNDVPAAASKTAQNHIVDAATPAGAKPETVEMVALDVTAPATATMPLMESSAAVAMSPPPSQAAKSFVTAPIPALHRLSETEVRALLKQLGYIYHNRLLRRENALLMSQLQFLKDQAQRSKTRGTVDTAHRLRVVVRIRPVGLASVEATAVAAVDPRRDSSPHVTTPAVLTSPDTYSLHSSSTAKMLPPQERLIIEDHNPLRASSVVTPLPSPHAVNPMSTEHIATAAAAAAAGTSVALTDVFLHCDFVNNRLQVRNPEHYVNNTINANGAVATARDSGASLRGVRIVGPPLPQSLSSIVSNPLPTTSTTSTDAVAALDAPFSSGLSHNVGENDQREVRVSALQAAAAMQQRTLYEEAVAPLVDGAIRGECGTVLSYGQVGSGKTYTMFGDCGVAKESGVQHEAEAKSAASPAEFEGLPAEAGVVPRAIADLFDQLRDKAASEELLLRSLYASRHDATFQSAMYTHSISTSTLLEENASVNLAAPSRASMCEVQCSMVELYGDRVRDLLAPKIKVPIYEEFIAVSTGVKGSAAYRSSSAERRLQRQIRQAQEAQLSQRESAIASVRKARSQEEKSADLKNPQQREQTEQRRILGYEYISPECAVRATEDGGARVEGAMEVTIHTLHEAMRLIQRGLSNREVRETASNPRSSRSHVIFTVTVKQQQWTCGTAASADAAPAAAKEEIEADVSAEEREEASASSTAAANKKTHKKTKTGTLVTAANDKTARNSAKKTKSKAANTKTINGTSKAAATSGVAHSNSASSGMKPTTSEKVETEEVCLDNAATAAEVEEQENEAQDRYLRRRSVKSVTSRLVFVDLAGTDRGTGQVSTVGAERLREAQAIGKGLAALSNVMTILFNGSSSGPSGAHVPFRSHRLTMLLRDALVKPTACVVLACVALSEVPMTALLTDTTLAVPPPSTNSTSIRSTSPVPPTVTSPTTAPTNAIVQYWRLATERFLAEQSAKAEAVAAVTTTSVAKRNSESVITLAPSLASQTTTTGSPPRSRHTSTPLSVRRGSLRNTSFAPSPSLYGASAKHKSSPKSTVLYSRWQSVPLIEVRAPSAVSSDGTDTTGRTNGLLRREQSSSVQRQRTDAAKNSTHGSVPIRTAASRRQQRQQQEQSVDPEFAAQLHAIQANADAEDRADAGALWITPRETLSTLMFLSRLWKA